MIWKMRLVLTEENNSVCETIVRVNAYDLMSATIEARKVVNKNHPGVKKIVVDGYEKE